MKAENKKTIKKGSTMKTEIKKTTKKGSTMKTIKNDTNYLTTTKAGKLSYDMVTGDIKNNNLMNDIFKNLSSLKSDKNFHLAIVETINNIIIARNILGENYRADYIGFLRGAVKTQKISEQARLLMNSSIFKKATMRQKYSSIKCLSENLGDTLINFEKHIENKTAAKTIPTATKTITTATKKEIKLNAEAEQTNKQNKIIVAQKVAHDKKVKSQIKSVKTLDTVRLEVEFKKAIVALKITPQNLVAIQNLVALQN